MKPINIVLCLILVLLVAFGAFFYTGGALQAEVSALSAAAADYPEAFEAVRGVLQSDSAPQRFSEELPQDAPGYSLLDVNIRLTNRGIFDAEWLNIQLLPTNCLVAVYSLTGDALDVSARGSEQINLKLITRAPAGSVRRVRIQYYVYGVSRTIEVDVRA